MSFLSFVSYLDSYSISYKPTTATVLGELHEKSLLPLRQDEEELLLWWVQRSHSSELIIAEDSAEDVLERWGLCQVTTDASQLAIAATSPRQQ